MCVPGMGITHVTRLWSQCWPTALVITIDPRDHEGMKAYSEDLRQRIVAVAERGMPKTEAAYLFGVSLSSIKRYTRMAREGGSLVPKK